MCHVRTAPDVLCCRRAGLTTTPLDVLKTRLMTQGTGDGRAYKNVLDCAAKIYREEGAAAFMRGWQPRVTSIAVGGCIFFGALEQAKKVLVPQTEAADALSGH